MWQLLIFSQIAAHLRKMQESCRVIHLQRYYEQRSELEPCWIWPTTKGDATWCNMWCITRCKLHQVDARKCKLMQYLMQYVMQAEARICKEMQYLMQGELRCISANTFLPTVGLQTWFLCWPMLCSLGWLLILANVLLEWVVYLFVLMVCTAASVQWNLLHGVLVVSFCRRT